MDIFAFIMLAGGLAFFLYGMHVMSGGLEKLAGGNLERSLRKMTANPLGGLLLGASVTAVIQSSSAVTVMLVGLVNSGVMQLHQAVGVIMGSNVGTTITAWILSLTGLEGDSFLIRILKPENFSLLFALAGVILLMMPRKKKYRDIGGILIGFAVLMYGMKMMSSAVEPLTKSEAFTGILTAFSNPIIGVITGMLFTAVIQSSSASVGVLQALSTTGSITYSAALPIILGQNIGTCITAILSCIGASKSAKKVAVVHLSFNVIGAAVFMIGFYTVNAFVDLPFMTQSIGVLGIAVIHSLFNLFTTAILFPFARQLEKLAGLLIRGTEGKEGKADAPSALIDERLLAVPAFAVSKCGSKTDEMAELAQNTVLLAIRSTQKYDEDAAQKIIANEDVLDEYEDALGTALVKISGKELTLADSRQVSLMLHTIGDFERMGDHALNLLDTAKEIRSKGISFSETAKRELDVMIRAVCDILQLTVSAYIRRDQSQAAQVEPFEQVIDDLVLDIKSRHIRRLQTGNCTIEMGFVLSDLLTNLERLSDHCSNVAAAVLELERDSYDTHRFLDELKENNTLSFTQYYEEFRRQYTLDRETV